MTKSHEGARPLVIVESPAKARTISRFLGPGYSVEASLGHVRDLPSTAAEIPAADKGKSWARLGVDIENDFEAHYIVPLAKKAHVGKLRAMLKGASEIYLATDEDREGEAIAWHLTQVLKPTVPVRRMVFHEITRGAIAEAIEHPRDLDRKLVDAQEARRILDRLYGYEVSPVLWRKIAPKLSAGRVQSVAVRLVVDRERARMRFKSADWWDLEAVLETRPAKDRVPARLVELGGRRVATGRDFDPNTGEARADVQVLDEARARSLAQALTGAPVRVESVQEKPFSQRPYPPFITSSLQQEAARKLRFSAQRTMRLAQSLYENGYITYMRTDSPTLSTQAVGAARAAVTELFGARFLPPEPRQYASRSKSAQEAHEAIRPAGESFRTPDSLRGELEDDQCRLYELIWKRTVASQMADATGRRTTVQLSADTPQDGRALFAATGRVLDFAGFLRTYVESTDEESEEENDRLLPSLAEGDVLDAASLEPRGHTTQPPARYTEASLIKELEERGIGRPSTYAAILQTVQDRGYVWKKGTALVPSFTAFAVTNLLERHFTELVDYDFTARMEEELDEIAAGGRRATPWLHDFYFGRGTEGGFWGMGLHHRIGEGSEAIDPRSVSSIPLQADDQGRAVVVRVGRYGPFLQAGEDGPRATVPDQTAPDELDAAHVRGLLERGGMDGRVLGVDAATGKNVYLKNGRFGPFVQLGEAPPRPAKAAARKTAKGRGKKAAAPADGGSGAAQEPEKPKMASLFPGMKMETLTLEEALLLLSFPRLVGAHPQTGEPIEARDGRYGPFVKMGTQTRSLRDHAQLATVTAEEAAALFAQPKTRRGAAQPRVLAELGAHPSRPGPLRVQTGRFGPYVTDGTVHASLPAGLEPAALTVERALELLAAREERLRARGIDPLAPRTRPTTRRRSSGPKKGASSGGSARRGGRRAEEPAASPE